MARTSRNDFARKVSERCNYLDPATIMAVHQGLLLYMLKELRDVGKVTIPDWGTFKITEHKERNVSLIRSKEVVRIPTIRTVKFEPCAKLKYYFRNISGMDGGVDEGRR